MKQNKFLTGLLIVTLLGAGALGFLLFQAKGKYSEAYDSYTAKAGELTALQGGRPFPDESNYKKMLDQQKAHQEAINGLQRQLAAAEIPLKPLTGVAFQDKLKASLDSIRKAAAQQNVALGKDTGKAFALGFDNYLTAPPKEEAAAALGRMLEAIEKAVLELIKTAPAEIKAVTRIPLPEEGLPGQRAAATPAPAKGGQAGKTAVAEKPLAQRFPFEIQFVAQEPKARSFINAMVSTKEQFYIPVAISILNQQVNGPSKVQSSESETAPPPPESPTPATPPDPNAPAATPAPAAPVAKFVVGTERLDVLARFEFVDFADAPAEKDSAKPEKKGADKAKQPAK